MPEVGSAVGQLLAKDPQLVFRTAKDGKSVSYLRGRIADIKGRSDEQIVSVLAGMKDVFGTVPVGHLRVERRAGDPHGGVTLFFQQRVGEVPVDGGGLQVHRSADGVLDMVRQHLIPGAEQVNPTPTISADQAVRAAEEDGNRRLIARGPAKLLIVAVKDKPLLVWEVDVEGKGAPTRKHTSWLAHQHGHPPVLRVRVDASTGQIVQRMDLVRTAGAVTVAGTGIYSGAGTVNAWFNDTTYQLRDTTRPGGPEIFTNDEDGTSPSSDADGDWNTLTTAPRDSNQGAEVDAHRYAGMVADYFQSVHSRNGIDGSGGAIQTLVHFGFNVDNAYWDGVRLKIGDGSGAVDADPSVELDYLCTPDIVAHEFTHGVTQYTCNLTYSNEPGALNEAFSDCFAAFITGDWLIGESCWLYASAPAMRNMADPTNGGNWNPADPIGSVLAGHQPSHYSQRYTGAADYGGVHINSGIINHLVYLLSMGGTHALSGITVVGLGSTTVEQLLYRTMSVELVGQPSANFLDFREAMLNACLVLFPEDLNVLTQTKNAFNAVGIGPDLYVRDNLADAGVEPYSGTALWASPDVINRTSMLANPPVDLANLSDDSLWQNVEYGQPNYAYVRVQNRGPASGDATVNVYFSPASSYGSPAGWIHVGAAAATAIAPGTMRVLGPITFPQGLIPSPGHYCMIAVTSSSLDPAPDHTLISDVGEYLSFVRTSNNIAYRNMDVVDNVAAFLKPFAFRVCALEPQRSRFDLEVLLQGLPNSAWVELVLPQRALGGVDLAGIKVLKRDAEHVRLLARPPNPIALDRLEHPRRPTLHGMLVSRPVEVQAVVHLPEEPGRRLLQTGATVMFRQRWEGKDVGSFGLRLLGKLQRRPKRPIDEDENPARASAPA